MYSNLLKETTIVDILSERSVKQPDKRAYTFLKYGKSLEQVITYQQLALKTKAVAALLQKVTNAGERVLILCPPGLEYISAFFGVLSAGAIAVPAYPPKRNKPMTTLQAIINDSGGKVVISSTEIIESIQSRTACFPGLTELHWLNIDEIPDEAAHDWYDPGIDSETLAFLQYTSGSTSTPKGVMLTHKNILHNLALIYDYFKHSQESKGVIWLPPYHDMGLIGGILQPLFGGFEVILMSPADFFQNPARWLKAITKYKATTCGGPNFTYDLCVNKITPEQCQELDLSSWDVAFCGAEPIRPETLKQFIEKFSPFGFHPDAFYPCYGLAEATLIVTGDKKAEPVKNIRLNKDAIKEGKVVPVSQDEKAEKATTLVGCGKPGHGQKLVIVDPETLKPCPADRIGEIWVSGESVAAGYWNQEEKTTEIFKAYFSGSATGPFLRTGDLGFMVNGELFITGRLKDLIIIRGKNYYPQDIELAIEKSHAALLPGSSAAFSLDDDNQTKLIIVHEVQLRHMKNLNSEDVFNAVQQAVTCHCELRVDDLVLIRAGRIPKTSSGKIRRNSCKAAYLMNQIERLNEHGNVNAKHNSSEKNISFIKKTLLALNNEEAKKVLLDAYMQQIISSIYATSSQSITPGELYPFMAMNKKQLEEFEEIIKKDLEVTIAISEVEREKNLSQLSSLILLEL